MDLLSRSETAKQILNAQLQVSSVRNLANLWIQRAVSDRGYATENLDIPDDIKERLLDAAAEQENAANLVLSALADPITATGERYEEGAVHR